MRGTKMLSDYAWDRLAEIACGGTLILVFVLYMLM